MLCEICGMEAGTLHQVVLRASTDDDYSTSTKLVPVYWVKLVCEACKDGTSKPYGVETTGLLLDGREWERM